jgi:6-pyruvoyl-tetrahydropterin synthase
MHDSSSPYGKETLVVNKWRAKANPRIEVSHYHAIIIHQRPFYTYFENVKKCERFGHGHSYFCID